MTVKNSLKNTNLRNTNFNVKDQFLQEVVDKRRNLIPAMIQARRQDKKAVLVVREGSLGPSSKWAQGALPGGKIGLVCPSGRAN